MQIFISWDAFVYGYFFYQDPEEDRMIQDEQDDGYEDIVEDEDWDDDKSYWESERLRE